MELSDLYLRN